MSPHPATGTGIAGPAGRELARVPALSVMQPWAYLILVCGKNIENRTWTTRYRGPLAIHAGRRADLNGLGLYQSAGLDWPPLPDEPATSRGALLGLVTLTGIHHAHDCRTDSQASCSHWGQPDRYHWQVTNPRLLAEPIPTPGQLRLWPVTLPATAIGGDR